MSAIKKEKEGRNMNEDKEFLGKEPIGKLLLRLALPTVAALNETQTNPSRE